MTSYPQPPRLELVLYWDLLLPTFALWCDIWNHINLVSVWLRATQWPNKFSFNCKNSTQNVPKVVFLSSKIEKNFWGGGSPDLSPVGSGTPPPHTLNPLLGAFGASILSPTALETRAFGARSPGFSRFTPGSWGASWNTEAASFCSREEGTGRQITWPPNATDKIGKRADETELAARQTTLLVGQYATSRQNWHGTHPAPDANRTT